MPADPSMIQVLYEVSLAIRPKSDISETIESAVSTYLQKLNCSAAVVFETMETPDGRLTHEVVATLPEQSTLTDTVGEIRRQLPETTTEFESALPAREERDGTYRYMMALPEFGVLVLCKRGAPLDDEVVRALSDLNEKLATACNRVAVPQQYAARHRELFQDAPVMFALTRVVDGEPVVVDCNSQFAETLGYTVEEVRDRPLEEFLTAESEGPLLDAEYDGTTEEFETEERTFRTRDGTRVVTAMRATPRLDDGGNIVGAQVLFVDVTELKRQKQQISVLNRVLRHNIRNDLTYIQGKVKMATDRNLEPAVANHISDIHDKTERLLSTADLARRIQGLLDRTDVNRQDLGTVVRSLVDRARTEYPEATVNATIEDGFVPVMATNAIDRGLWELVENACEHGGDEPTVTITMEQSDTTASVVVADNGPGIPDGERQVIGAGKETSMDHGTGLGLWLVHWVVEISGGELSIDCDDGTVATVALPLGTETEE